MKCPKCNSENIGIHDRNMSPYKTRMQCHNCKHRWNVPDSEVGTKSKATKPKVGMTIDQFKEQYDTEYRLDKALKELSPELIYEKQDIMKLAGLPISAPGASTVLETRKDYYGKISGKMLFSHPDTIRDLKEQAKLS